MLGYALIFAGALALSAGTTPILRRLAVRVGFIDVPDARKGHREPIPLLGGAVIYLAAVLVLLARGGAVWSELVAILGGATVVALIGLVDDRMPLTASIKLAGQLLGVGLMMAGGVSVQLTGVTAIDGLLTAGWMVVLVNAFNFSDNMDGMAGGLGAIASLWFLFLAAHNGQLLVAPLAAATAGACLGFLLYNFNPATIFMGDAGSQFLGFILAALAIKLRFPGDPVFVTWWVPVLIMAPVLFDLALVTVSRLRRGVNPFVTAGHDHLSHRLVARGLSTSRAVAAVYAASILTGGLAALTPRLPMPWAWLPGLTVLVAGGALLWHLEWRPAE